MPGIRWLLCLLVACSQPPERGARPQALDSGERDYGALDLEPAAGPQYAATVVADGSDYIVVWSDGREVYDATDEHRAYYARVADGTVLDATGLPLAPAHAFWSALGVVGACDGAGGCLFLAAGEANESIRGVRTQAGAVVDPTPLVLVDAGHWIVIDAVAWDGGAFRIVWTDRIANQLWTARVDGAGALGPAVLITAADRAGRIACQQPRCLVTYIAGDDTLRGRTIDPDDALGTEQLLYGTGERKRLGSSVWDGTQYWVALTNNAVTDASEYGAVVWAVRANAAGASLDPAGIAVTTSSTTHAPGGPLVQHDGTHAIVSWSEQDDHTGFAHRAARITSTGVVVDPGGAVLDLGQVTVLAPDETRFQHAFACTGSSCFMAWANRVNFDDGIRGSRIAGTTLLDGPGIELARSPHASSAAAIAYGLDHYAAVWRDSRPSPGAPGVATLRGVIASPDGTATAAFQATTPSMSDPPPDQPAIAATANAYVVVWRQAAARDADQLFGQAFDVGGAALGPGAPIAGSGHEFRPAGHPAIASSGGEVLVAWDEAPNQEAYEDRFLQEIRVRRHDAAGAPIGTHVVVGNGSVPAVAFDGASYVVVWQKAGLFSSDIFARRISAAGEPIGPPQGIATVEQEDEDRPSIACGGGTCLAVWHATKLRAARIAPDGTVLDPGGFDVGDAGDALETSVAWDGTSFLVAWSLGGALVSARVDASGAVVQPASPLASPATRPDRPAIAASGQGAMVLYDRFDDTPAFRTRRVRAITVGPGPAPEPDPDPDPEPNDPNVGPDAGCGCRGSSPTLASALAMLLLRRRSQRAARYRSRPALRDHSRFATTSL